YVGSVESELRDRLGSVPAPRSGTQIPHRRRDIFLELDSTHDVDLGQPDAAGGLYLTVASVPTASSPMSSTMTMTKSERRIRVMALVTVSSTRWRRTRTPSDSKLNQSTCSPGRNVLQWPAAHTRSGSPANVPIPRCAAPAGWGPGWTGLDPVWRTQGQAACVV